MTVSNYKQLQEDARQERSIELFLSRYANGQTANSYDSIEGLSQDKGVDVSFFEELLAMYANTDYFPKKQLKQFPLPIIIDYLKSTHQYYLSKRLMEIEQSVLHLNDRVESEMTARLVQLFSGFKRSISGHIFLEERFLFPYIDYLLEATRCAETHEEMPTIKDYGLNEFSMQAFESCHHDEPENILKKMVQYILDFSPTLQDLSSYRILITQLVTFEKDLCIHAKVEDEILLPLGIEMELKMQENT
jgi:regulator of cell morphogenesis and NO signaling